MLKLFKNKIKGFTLIEVVVSIAIVAMLAGLAITSISAISQSRMRQFAQTIKSEFELTRNFAKSHGGDAVFTITKVEEGLEILRTGENLTSEKKLLKDANLSLFYKATGDDTPYELGQKKDGEETSTDTISVVFSQTNGAVIGPDLSTNDGLNMLDSITISNGTKNYTLLIKQNTGMMYYDYEAEDVLKENVVKSYDDIITVKKPTFLDENGLPTNEGKAKQKNVGDVVQPIISYNSRYVKISGEYRADKPKNDGYTIIFTLKDPHMTQWQGGGTDPIELKWFIDN